MDLGLSGKNVIVSGGASNIGRAIVLAFANEGARVVCADKDEEQARKTVQVATALGVNALAVTTDVTDPDSVQAMVQRALDAFGRIDILVNNVGLARQVYLTQDSRENLELDVRVNLWSVLNCTRSVAEHMMVAGGGKIINISSGAGRIGIADSPIYSAMKGAVISLTKSLAKELGRYGINVNAVAPGWVIPRTSDERGEGSAWQATLDQFPQEMTARIAKASPLGRLGEAGEVADMVVFLASDRAGYVTGQTVSVDGGMTMV